MLIQKGIGTMRHSNSTVRPHETLEIVSTVEGPECPQVECKGRMQTNPMGNIVPLIGLQQVCCTHCDHQGMVSREGIRLLFRGGNEYLFSYGNSVTTLTVVLAAHTVDVFGSYGLGPDILAKRAAEWVLLKGQCTGTVDLSLENPTCAEFYRLYCVKHVR
jgi:hypothetical protein